jgi:Trp operon repressor
MNKWCEKEINEMVDLVSSCKDSKEVSEVFDIILTPREINDMARRLKILRLLEEGQSYSEIRMRLGVGSDLIGRVANRIGFGFRRVAPGAAKKEMHTEWKDPLQRKKGVYYKGVPSPGTMLGNLKK